MIGDHPVILDQFSLREGCSSLNSLTFYSEKYSAYPYPLQKNDAVVASTRRDALHAGGRRTDGRRRGRRSAGHHGRRARLVEAIDLGAAERAASGGQHR